jgi:penicillin-binding protein 1A
MAPVLPSALGATEVPLIEMVSAYSAFPNKGVRMEPHLIRKVIDRDGKILEEWDGANSRVTSEYVAGTMVQMMQGVVRGGGTAAGASAGGHPLAGKTGTVNDHTDVWFMGYTPTYVAGIWMGNPEKKTDLGSYMTGGHGAVPYFNAFMIPFMKDKPRDNFSSPPSMPAEIRALNEQRKREQIEKLERADEIGRRLSLVYGTNSAHIIPKTGPDESTPTDTNSNSTEKSGETPPAAARPNEEKPESSPSPAPETAPTPKRSEILNEKPKPAEAPKRNKKGEKDEK